MFCALLSVLVLSTPSPTLTYVNRADAGQHLILRRDGDRLVIIDHRSRAIIASAPAAETRRVIVRGADGGRDDTLTLDLSNPISLPGGIDYDGGAGGWDTLVVTGGFVQKETVTPLSPQDGLFDLDGLLLRYANLEPTTDTVAAASLTVFGSGGADIVTISDGPGAGEATISSSGNTFESYTFANKTNVIFDGGGGVDSVTINNPTPPTGLASFIIQNVATVGQTTGFAYPAFGVSATGTVDLDDVASDVDNIEIVTQSGNILYTDVDGVTIGGVSAVLTGFRVVNNGSITLFTSGLMNLADADGLGIIHSGIAGGDVFLQAFGIGSDIVATVNNLAAMARGGSVSITAGGNLFLGTGGPNFNNDVRASSFVALNANFDMEISGSTNVVSDFFGNNTGGSASATAGQDFLLSDTTGPGATFGAGGAAGADTSVTAIAGSVNVTADSASALFSSEGDVSVTANRLIIQSGSGISATAGSVLLSSLTVPVDLGSSTDAAAALEISDAEADLITTLTLSVQSAAGSNLTVTQPITFAGALTLRSENTISATGAGSLSLGPAALTIDDLGNTARTWTINGTSVTISPGAAIPYSGVFPLNANGGSASDTFNVTPVSTTAINIDGNSPTPPASPGDTLNVNTAGTISPSLHYTSGPSGYAGGYTFDNRPDVRFSEIETLNAATDLAVTKTDNTTSETPGTAVSYTIVASNPGPLGIFGATVVDTFPPELSNISWTCIASLGSTCNLSGSGGLNEIVGLDVGGTANFHVTATISPTATGSLSNSVTIAPPNGTSDPNSANNTATDVDTLAAAANLAVSKTTLQASYTPGGTITYTISLINSGPGSAADVALTDSLPPNTTFNSLSAPGSFTCSTPAPGANGMVSCTNPSLAVSTSTFTLVVNVIPAATGIIANTASATTTSSDTNGANNSSTASLSSSFTIPTMSSAMLMLLGAVLGFIALMAMKRM